MRTLAFGLLGALAFIVSCEFVLQILPVSTATRTGYHLDPLILTYPPQHRWTTSTGWDLRNAQTHRANNFGFLADRDFVREERAVALIGDSFVEASMLHPADRLAPRFERWLGRPVYALGGPGSAILDYAERIRFAHEKFGISDFVILMEQGDLRQSLCGSGNIHGPCIDKQTLALRNELQAPANLAKRILRDSALAQYLFGQIKLSPHRFWRQILDQSRPVTMESAAAQKKTDFPKRTRAQEQSVAAVAETFLVRVKPHVQRLVVVVDHGRGNLRESITPIDSDLAWFMNFLRAQGIAVIDAEPLYRTHMAASPLSLDVGPYDTHLNGIGLELIALAIATTLKAETIQKGKPE